MRNLLGKATIAECANGACVVGHKSYVFNDTPWATLLDFCESALLRFLLWLEASCVCTSSITYFWPVNPVRTVTEIGLFHYEKRKKLISFCRPAELSCPKLEYPRLLQNVEQMCASVLECTDICRIGSRLMPLRA
jgi:hypothetical protein